MGKYKEYIIDLAEKLGKEFEDVTQNDIDFDMMKKAQNIWADSNSTHDLKEEYKVFLPTVSIDLTFSHSLGDVIIQENSLTGQKYFYLVV